MEHTHNEKQDGEHGESRELERFATPAVDDEECGQVTRQEGCRHDDHGIYDIIVEAIIYISRSTIRV